MTQSSKEVAVAIPLNVWQDPQGDVVLRTSRECCAVYFGCWTEAGDPADYLCCLHFQHAWAVRGFCLELMPYQTEQRNFRSSIYQVETSQFLKASTEQRARDYPQWLGWDKKIYRHYVVSGHDNYFDIIASGYEEQVIQGDEVTEFAYLIEQA